MYIEGPLRTGNTLYHVGSYGILWYSGYAGTSYKDERGLLPEHCKITGDHNNSKCTRLNNFKGGCNMFLSS